MESNKTGTPIVKKFSTKKGGNGLILGVISVVIVLAGVGTGYLFSGKKISNPTSGTSKMETTENQAGIEDTTDFPDSAEGELLAGGISGEGTHHLERAGGPSKNVYLTSTVIDLESFVGKKVMVWGQTISGQSAGWLMDVGKIKVVE